VVISGSITVTTAEDFSAGSLRSAMISADASIVDGYTWYIEFAPSLAGQMIQMSDAGEDDTFGTSLFECANRIIVDGKNAPGVVISRDFDQSFLRFFNVKPTGQLTLRNLTLTGGIAGVDNEGTSGAGGGGGGVGFGGAIYNQGFLAMENVILENNGAVGADGGDWSDGSPGIGGLPYGGDGNTLTNRGFGGGVGGSADCGGGGGMGAGGAIFNNGGTVIMKNCVVSDSYVFGGSGGAGKTDCSGSDGDGLGAGVFNLNGTVTILSSIFTNGFASSVGSGIYNLADGGAASLILDGVTITNSFGTNDLFLATTNNGDSHLTGKHNQLGNQNAPWILPMRDVGVSIPDAPLLLNFTVSEPTGQGSYSLNATSGDQSIVPNTKLSANAVGENGTLNIALQSGILGQTTVTVTVSEGNLSSSESFDLSLGLFAKCVIDGEDRVIRFNAEPGQTFTIEHSETLPATWTSLGDATETGPGQFEFRHVDPGLNTGFYRIVKH
jgi:hypothetical protein